MESSHVCFTVALLPLPMFSRNCYRAGQERGYGSLSGQMSGGLGSMFTSHQGLLISSVQGDFSTRKLQGSGFQPLAIQVGENQGRVRTEAKRSQSVTLWFVHSLSHQECAARSKIKQADMTILPASFSPFLKKCWMTADPM